MLSLLRFKPLVPSLVMASSSSSSIYRGLFLFLLFFCLALWIASSSPIEFSHLSRVMEIQHRERESALVQETAVRGLLDRLLPSHSSSFEFEIISKDVCGGKACFSISNHPLVGREGSPEILIRGVTGVEISAGLHWYLKYFCGAHVSWEKTGGAQLSSVPKPGSLHTVPSTGILIQRPIQWSYYQNAVTSSYSFAWWDWERLEKELDGSSRYKFASCFQPHKRQFGRKFFRPRDELSFLSSAYR